MHTNKQYSMLHSLNWTTQLVLAHYKRSFKAQIKWTSYINQIYWHDSSGIQAH